MVCDNNLVLIEMDLDSNTVNLLADIQNTTFTTVSLGDDNFSDSIDLGFTFTFYGYNYSSCILSSNNFISFDTSFASQSSPYTISNTLPDASNNINASKLKNTILAPWQDIQPNAGGLLNYATVGTSPNRIFVVRWFDVPMYLCNNLFYSSAILLYENGNKIETHIVNKPDCTWNNGLAIHGLQNKTGSIAEIITDPINGLARNVPNTWSTTTEGVRFSPNGINDYTTAFIDFIPIVSVSNLLWSTTDSTLLGIGSSLNWDPNSSTNDIDTIIVNSPSYLSTFTDTIVLISNPGLNISLPNGSPCNFDSVILEHNIDYADSVLWSTGENTPTIQVFGNGLYSVTAFIEDCSYTKSLFLLFNQSDFNLGNDTLLCAGDSLIAGDPYFGASYTWQDGFNEPIYKIKESGTYYVDMILNGCLYSDTIVVNFTPPLIFPSDTMVCDGNPFDIEINYPNATYLWQDGSTDSIFTVSQTGTYDVTVTTNTCIFTADVGVIFIDSITLDLGPDTTICFGDTLFIGENYLSANYLWQDGSTPVKYNVIETGLYHCEITVGNCTVSDTIFVQVNPLPEVDLGGEIQICEGDTIILEAFTPGATYIWGNGTDTLSTDTIFEVTGAGIYTVEVQSNNCYSYDTVLVINVSLLNLDLGPDTTILCDGDFLDLDASAQNATYLWQDGSTNPNFVVNQPGLYYVEVFFGNCSLTDTILVQSATTPFINLGPNVTICFGDTLWLDATFPNVNNYTWQDGNSNATYGVFETGTYIVDVTLNNCIFSDTIEVIVNPVSSFDLGPDQTICANNNLVLGGFTPGATYLWNNGSTQSYQNINQTGLYILEVNLNGCLKSDSIYVTVVPVPNFSLGPDIILCTGESILLDAFYPGASYTWQDGDTSSNYFVNSSGIYSAVLELNGCTSKDQINVTVIDSINIELPDTISFCLGDSYMLNATFLDSGTTYSWNDGDSNPIHEVSEPGLTFVTLTLGGCVFSDSTFVVVHPLPVLNLSDTNICSGDNIIFNAYNQEAITYLWQDGSQNSTFTASEEGWYSVTIQNDHCETTDSAYLSLTFEPEIFLPEDTFLCEDNTIIFNFTDTNYQYQWGNGMINNQYSISEPGIYTLLVRNKCGETYSTMAVTQENCLCTMFIPNSFSPNGDNTNESFEFFPECELSNFQLQIFNRWGKMMFTTDNPLHFWDGTYKGDILVQESYIYKVKYSFTNESIVYNKTGSIVLIK